MNYRYLVCFLNENSPFINLVVATCLILYSPNQSMQKVSSFSILQEPIDPNFYKSKVSQCLGHCKFEEALDYQRKLISCLKKEDNKNFETNEEIFFASDIEKLSTLDFSERDKTLNAMYYYSEGEKSLKMFELNNSMKNFSKSRDIIKALIGEETLLYMKLTERIGFVYLYIGDFGRSKPELKKFINLWKKFVSEDNGLYSFSLINLGLCCLKTGDSEEAEKLFKSAVKIESKKFGTKTLRYATLLAYLSEAHFMQNKFDIAKNTAMESIMICEDFGQEAAPCLGYNYQIISLIELQQKNIKSSENLMNASFSFYKLSPKNNFQTRIFMTSLTSALEKLYNVAETSKDKPVAINISKKLNEIKNISVGKVHDK